MLTKTQYNAAKEIFTDEDIQRITQIKISL